LPKGSAEEIVQDVFLKLWQRRTTFADLRSVKAFLYIATKNACFNDHAREQVRHRRHEQYLYTVDELEDAIVDEIIHSEVLREVARAMDTLPEQCRRIVEMAYADGLTPTEIAKALNRTVSTVYNQASRGVRLLRQPVSR